MVSISVIASSDLSSLTADALMDFIPVSAIRIKDNKKYVQILENKKTVSKEVITGIKNSMGMIEIISGLEEGEQVMVSIQNKSKK